MAHQVAERARVEQHVATVRPLDDVEDLVHPVSLVRTPSAPAAIASWRMSDSEWPVNKTMPGPWPMAPNESQHVRAAAVGQRVVHEDDVGGLLPQQRADFGQAWCVAQELVLARVAFEGPAQEVCDELVIIDQGDADGPDRGRSPAGSYMVVLFTLIPG